MTYGVQSFASKREQREMLKERLMAFLLVTKRIVADMQDVKALISKYQHDNPETFDLWKAVHTFRIKPNVQPDLTGVEVLVRLRSSALIAAAMHSFSEYNGLMNKIAIYDQMRLAYIADRGNIHVAKDRISVRVENLKNHIALIDETSAALIIETHALQQKLHRECSRHFGNAKFLEN